MQAVRGYYPELPKRVEVIDCTLRDGEQAPGVWFSVDEKLALASQLSAAGVDLLDAGFPASSEVEVETLQALRGQGLTARIGATARPVTSDIMAAERARAHEVFLFMPTSELRLRETLGVTTKQARQLFRRGAEEVLARGMALNLVLEDATRADRASLLRTVEALRPHVAIARLVICDTVGCAHPAGMHALIRALDGALDGEVALCVHTHNDFGMAGANTLAAVAAGARAITCTVNGIGERAGNADLAECAAALTHIYGVEHGIDPHRLAALSHAVELGSGIHMSPIKPVTGSNVYRHESGVHVDAMLKNAQSYEFLPASWSGRRSEYVLGKHSGGSLVRHLLERAGLAAPDERVQELLQEVKATAIARDKLEHRRAFSAHESFTRACLSGIDPATLLALAQRRIAG
jgi:isopropylmalate/homocitrate/citramalate synthase